MAKRMAVNRREPKYKNGWRYKKRLGSSNVINVVSFSCQQVKPASQLYQWRVTLCAEYLDHHNVTPISFTEKEESDYSIQQR